MVISAFPIKNLLTYLSLKSAPPPPGPSRRNRAGSGIKCGFGFTAEAAKLGLRVGQVGPQTLHCPFKKLAAAAKAAAAVTA